MKRIETFRRGGMVCPLDTCPDSNLVDVPGDGMYKVPREIACAMQRIKRESPIPVVVLAETLARQFYVMDMEGNKRAIATFEWVEDQGIVGVVDFLCSLLNPETDVVRYDITREEVEVSVKGAGTVSLTVSPYRRRIVLRKEEGETKYEERIQ